MKKKYSKPMIVFEDFSLSTSIASDCEYIVDNPSRGHCAVDGSGGISVFTTSIAACIYTPEGLPGGAEGVYDGACYHVPFSSYDMFNS